MSRDKYSNTAALRRSNYRQDAPRSARLLVTTPGELATLTVVAAATEAESTLVTPGSMFRCDAEGAVATLFRLRRFSAKRKEEVHGVSGSLEFF